MSNKKVYPGTQAVSRAITILNCFNDAHPDQSLLDLCETTGLNRTTVYRILSALEHAGFIAYNA
ncbi:MAG: helix-turn-helix domain-containing protein, partial [Chloroflexota bacterium]